MHMCGTHMPPRRGELVASFELLRTVSVVGALTRRTRQTLKEVAWAPRTCPLVVALVIQDHSSRHNSFDLVSVPCTCAGRTCHLDEAGSWHRKECYVECVHSARTESRRSRETWKRSDPGSGCLCNWGRRSSPFHVEVSARSGLGGFARFCHALTEVAI